MRFFAPPGRRASFRALGKASLVAALSAAALVVRAGPSAAQASRLPEGLPQQSPIPFIAPPEGPRLEPGLKVPGAEAYPNTAPATPVAVSSVTVEGSTVLTPQQAAAMTQGLVGAATPMSAIEAARLRLLESYRGDGYPLVTVAAALGTNGQLRFNVIEGRISEVKLDGDIGPAGSKVLAFLNNLIQPGPTSAASLERWLLTAQDVPGVTLETVLRPSETEPGSLVLVARVTRTAISGFVVADNRAYQYTGPAQVLAVAGYNSLTSWGERTEVSIYKSLFNSTQIFGQADIETFIGNSGLKFRIYGGAGDTVPNGTLKAVGYNGDTQVGGMQLSYPLLYSRQQKLNLLALFDVFETTTYEATTGSSGPNSHDGLRIFRLGADYARLDQLFGSARPAENRISFKLSHGIDGLGSSNNGNALLSRQGEVMGFTALSAQISRNQTLFSPWSDATVSMLTLLTGQYSHDILPPEEEFHLGGLQFTRGYYSGEVSGDSAIAATLELQLSTSAHVEPPWVGPRDVGLQFYTYYDWGQTYQNRALDAPAHIGSLGLGVRSSLTRNLEFDIEGVTRLNRQPQGSSSSISELAAQAYYWRLLVRF